jgi:4'-phosphopantetheinyl transferase
MRQILGACLHRRPSDVKFLYENLGKPFLDKRDNPDELAFNFSNSRDLGLLAVTGRCPHLGVDLEYVRWPRDLTGLAERFFDAGETEMLLAAPMAEQQQAFFRLWTRKEAFLKAVGKGLTFPLKDVVVTQRAEEPARILSIQGSATAANDWYVESLRLPADYIGAVVYSGFQRGVFVREYT